MTATLRSRAVLTTGATAGGVRALDAFLSWTSPDASLGGQRVHCDVLEPRELVERRRLVFPDGHWEVRISQAGIGSGECTLMLDREAASQALQRTLGPDAPTNDDHVLRDFLGELGNLALNAFVGTLANILGTEVPVSVPEVSWVDARREPRAKIQDTYWILTCGPNGRGTEPSAFQMLWQPSSPESLVPVLACALKAHVDSGPVRSSR